VKYQKRILNQWIFCREDLFPTGIGPLPFGIAVSCMKMVFYVLENIRQRYLFICLIYIKNTGRNR